MIVISNAFVFSTCLLVVVSRYGLLYFFFQNLCCSNCSHLKTSRERHTRCNYKGFLCIKLFPSFSPLGSFNLGAVTLLKYHKLKARGYPFIVTHVSIISWDNHTFTWPALPLFALFYVIFKQQKRSKRKISKHK